MEYNVVDCFDWGVGLWCEWYLVIVGMGRGGSRGGLVEWGVKFVRWEVGCDGLEVGRGMYFDGGRMEGWWGWVRKNVGVVVLKVVWDKVEEV